MSLYRRNIMQMANPKPVFECDTSVPILLDSEIQLFNGRSGLTEWTLIFSTEGDQHKIIGGTDSSYGISIYHNKVIITNSSNIDYIIKFNNKIIIKRDNFKLYYDNGFGWNEIPVGDSLNYTYNTFKINSLGLYNIKCKIYNKSNIKL